jgi:hypothetical protein
LLAGGAFFMHQALCAFQGVPYLFSVGLGWEASNPKLQAFKKLAAEPNEMQCIAYKSFFYGTARRRRVPVPKKFQAPNLKPQRATASFRPWFGG